MSPVHNKPIRRKYSKQLRKNLTPAEAILWKVLKTKQLGGRKFRRQHSVENYILDFYCPSEMLAIEVDGGYHKRLEIAQNDMVRDELLNQYGIKVLRFENEMIYNHLEIVIDTIRKSFKS